jgi:hypothetical protein
MVTLTTTLHPITRLRGVMLLVKIYLEHRPGLWAGSKGIVFSSSQRPDQLWGTPSLPSTPKLNICFKFTFLNYLLLDEQIISLFYEKLLILSY